MIRVLLLFALVCHGGAALGVETLSDYRLGSGDQIKIAVYDEPELSFEVRLSDAGTISFPFLGEIRVLGLTVGDLERKIRQGLQGDYLVEPEVSVSIKEYREFYIHGEVESPGSFSFVPGITLRKAIALAGGFTERASRRKIYVIHEDSGVKEQEQPMALGDAIKPGDIVTVEQSFF